MNNKPDLRLSFDPDQPLANVSSAPRSWLPVNLPRDMAISYKYWLTRGARGISWHRSGLVSQEPLR